ncbi:MAG: rod shape-determining protein, partial [Desulfomicrobium escambiense]|nr:rod shape-determining protein [Desulfomicrobium escambiense]
GVTALAFRSLFSLFSSDLAIDLGTANTCVYARGRGIVVNEPSIVAINKVNGKVEAVGKAAKEMLGRTPGNIVAIKPMKDGVIADFEVTEKMLTYFIKQAHNGAMWVRPAHRHRRAVGDHAGREARREGQRATARRRSEVYLIEEAMAAAIGAGHADHRADGQHDRRHRRRHDRHRRDLARGHRLLARRCASPATRWTRRSSSTSSASYNLLIGERTAEQIKMEIGSAFPLDERLTHGDQGARTSIEGVPKTITITDEEIREALAETVSVDRRRRARGPRAHAAGAVGRHRRPRHRAHRAAARCCSNLDKRLREETGLPLSMAEDPLSSVVLGAGKMLADFNLLRKISID